MAGKRRYSYDYPRPMVTTDCALLRVSERRLEILLVKRAKAPHKGSWVLPGGFIKMKEPLKDAALRELGEETGIKSVPLLLQLGAYGSPQRDPRGRVISVVFMGIVAGNGVTPSAGDDAAEAAWFPVEKLPGKIGFDHATIIGDALLSLGALESASGILFAFLPKKTFSENDLADVLFAVYGVELKPKDYLAPFVEGKLVRRTRGGEFRFVG